MVHQRILVGLATDEMARRADFYDYWENLEYPKGESFKMKVHARSPAKARNTIFQAAVDQSCTHVCVIDDDMVFPPDTLMKLLKHDADVVSALYPKRAFPFQPLIFDEVNPRGECLFMYLNEAPGLRAIQACGFGFCVIKVELLKKMRKPWVRLGEIDYEDWSDDIGFFKRMRDEIPNVQMWCDTSVTLGHVGTCAVALVWHDESNQWMVNINTDGKNNLAFPHVPDFSNIEFVEG